MTERPMKPPDGPGPMDHPAFEVMLLVGDVCALLAKSGGLPDDDAVRARLDAAAPGQRVPLLLKLLDEAGVPELEARRVRRRLLDLAGR